MKNELKDFLTALAAVLLICVCTLVLYPVIAIHIVQYVFDVTIAITIKNVLLMLLILFVMDALVKTGISLITKSISDKSADK